MSRNRFFPSRQKLKRDIWNRDGWKCFYCGSELNRETATVDHKTPLSRGGSWHASNLVTSCRKCNFSKGSLDLIEFKLICCWRRKLRSIVFPGEHKACPD
jgi:5-methylcytosine-specific restriction endonuclease McrA